jgi:hypothetical protein
MPAAKKLPCQKQPLEPLTKRLVPLTPSDTETLTALAQEASDRIGRTIGGAAIVRALIRLAGAGALSGETIAEQIEREVKTGRHWGAKKRVT